MEINIFLPKYMAEFKCICSSCTDSCCAGWDINIDEDTYNKYLHSTGEFNHLLERKFTENKNEHDSFNHGFMILKDESRCPFLNSNMLCDIHGGFGEENLCITCRSYPRVFNIVDNIYEKSGLPSCIEICSRALLNKNKMEFIESTEEISEEEIEIRRIIDTEAFDGTESLLQYFWDIRLMSINIIQNRSFSIEERLNILKSFYEQIQEKNNLQSFDDFEALMDNFNDEEVDYENLKGINFSEDNEFYRRLGDYELLKNIRSVKLKECVKEYKAGILKCNNVFENTASNGEELFSPSDISGYLENIPKHFKELETYSYVFENYIVNQIFKDLVPFNKGESLTESVKALINSYRIIKAYVIGIAINSEEKITGEKIIRVIQALSKDIEHNKVFKNLLEK
ncbi:flagellar biosynthetic protein FliU [Clostridium puniceum]|uniref:Flagellar biosynthetic protein FliU n=1 Tax=Clostridium puniceum TaxID=29367 RepID=A0A1S8TWL1_9CLOT|nr:flagellin lysine-N-methylase [Clostridium puniceum]OOM82147.1 flagellar biosynthetic protein FliU [Clostridium puniceum]